MVSHSPAPIIAYLERHQLSQTDFADLIGKSQSAVSQWLKKKKGIGIKTAERIERKTKGEITITALYPRLFAKAA